MPFDNAEIGLIILAAGNSRRMNGKPKQLLEFGGKSLLRRAAEVAVQAKFHSTVVVLGGEAENLKSEIADLPVEAVFNIDSAIIGISASIKKGMTALSGRNLDAVIVMLCDQPLITTENLHALRDSFIKTGNLIVASAYENTVGVPALFARALFAELSSLKEDEGAKKVIEKHNDKTVLVSAPEAAFDVDTFEDYEKLKKYIK